MSDAAGASEWPGGDAVAVALAAKIAMLAAASRTCAVEPSSQDQRDLLEQVAAVTALKHVNGRPFDEFLGDAKERLATRAVEERLDSGRAAATLSDIADARPVDIIGDLYPELVRLAADLYEPVLGERIDPPLERDVLEYGPSDRPLPFEGHVPASRTSVLLSLYSAKFDLHSLALMPYVITHELICHIGARAIKRSRHQPDTAIRMFFADGFMDRVAWLLVTLWLDSAALEHDIPVGHLTESDVDTRQTAGRLLRGTRRVVELCGRAQRRYARGGSRDGSPGRSRCRGRRHSALRLRRDASRRRCV